MPRRNGAKTLGLYLPKVKQYLTISMENFKKSVLNAGGKVLGLYLPEVKK